jgi:hypothetical protein
MNQDLAQAAATLKRTALEVERARSEVQRAESAAGIRRLSYERMAAVAKSARILSRSRRSMTRRGSVKQRLNYRRHARIWRPLSNRWRLPPRPAPASTR